MGISIRQEGRKGGQMDLVACSHRLRFPKALHEVALSGSQVDGGSNRERRSGRAADWQRLIVSRMSPNDHEPE